MTSKNNKGTAPEQPVASGKSYAEAGADQARILIAPRRGANAMKANIQPLSAVGFKSQLSQIQGLQILKTIKSTTSKISPLAVTGDEASECHVASIHPDMLDIVKQSAPAHLIIETDHHLEYGDAVTNRAPIQSPLQLNAAGTARGQKIAIQVLDQDGKPVPNISAILTGDAFPSKGLTNANGEVELDLFAMPGNGAKSLFLLPTDNYWNRFITNPRLDPNQINTIQIQSLTSTVPNFPKNYPFGWGAQRMGLDKISPKITGAGVKIAVIDSGAATDHPLLKHIKYGKDLTEGATATSWTKDTVGHGSHVSGTIGASGEKGMLRGFAPEAEIHELKVFPGGRFSSLLEALDYCIENDIDVVNMSLGSPNASEVVEQKLEEAYMHGIFLVAAAGNSGGPVQFPAISTYTMAVSAIGLLNQYPADSWDAKTVQSEFLTPDGTFSPTFTCTGPQINISAPGVAIISTVPNKAYDAKSGTSMAAPHIAGAAAVLLAHHPMFKTTLNTRSVDRTQALYELMKSVAVPHPFGAERVGFGTPHVDLVNELYAVTEESEQAQAATNAAQNIIYRPVSDGYRTQYQASNQAGQIPVQAVTWVAQPNGFRHN